MVLTKKAILAYCSTTTGFSLISTAYSFYYVKVFMNIYHIKEGWFQGAQILYLVWNAINDPLFAYVQDSTNLKFTRTRRESIMYSGPLFACSFLLPWIPWGDNSVTVGIHLIISLFIWDTLFTFVGLAQCTLSAEISIDPLDRITLNRYGTVGSMLGSSSVLVLEYASDSLDNFKYFQITAVFIAGSSWILFRYAGLNAHTAYDIDKVSKDDGSIINNISHDKAMDEPFWKQTWQILSDRNFLAFVIANFCQEFHRTFQINFMAIICDQLISDREIPRTLRKTFYGAVTIMPKLLVIIASPLIVRYSYFHVIRGSHVYKVLSGMSMFLIGQNHPWCLMLFLMLDSCFTDASYSLLCLPLSDIADDNMTKHNRKHPISSMVFGTNALIVKPAISLSPMLVVAILNKYGYNELQNKSSDINTANPVSVQLNNAMFVLICCYPIIIGCIQFVSWSTYKTPRKIRQVMVDV